MRTWPRSLPMTGSFTSPLRTVRRQMPRHGPACCDPFTIWQHRQRSASCPRPRSSRSTLAKNRQEGSWRSRGRRFKVDDSGTLSPDLDHRALDPYDSAGAVMSSWQKRLRDLVLAGGTLAAAACSSNGSGNPSVPCCNANPDPCCTYQSCNAPMSPACACRLDGGIYDYSHARCGPVDAGAEGGAGLSDAGHGGGGG